MKLPSFIRPYAVLLSLAVLLQACTDSGESIGNVFQSAWIVIGGILTWLINGLVTTRIGAEPVKLSDLPSLGVLALFGLALIPIVLLITAIEWIYRLTDYLGDDT